MSVSRLGILDLSEWCWCARLVGEQSGSEWAASWHLAVVRLSPALTLEWNSGIRTQVLLELVLDADVVTKSCASVRQSALTPGLSGILVLGGAELASGLGCLLERLLLLCVGKADLDLQLTLVGRNRVIVEGGNDFFASSAALEAEETCQSRLIGVNVGYVPGKPNTTADAIVRAQDARRADFVWSEKVAELVLIHACWQVGDVEIGVALVREGLELRVERFL
jgi:hypothetical protein